MWLTTLIRFRSHTPPASAACTPAPDREERNTPRPIPAALVHTDRHRTTSRSTRSRPRQCTDCLSCPPRTRPPAPHLRTRVPSWRRCSRRISRMRAGARIREARGHRARRPAVGRALGGGPLLAVVTTVVFCAAAGERPRRGVTIVRHLADEIVVPSVVVAHDDHCPTRIEPESPAGRASEAGVELRLPGTRPVRGERPDAYPADDDIERTVRGKAVRGDGELAAGWTLEHQLCVPLRVRRLRRRRERLANDHGGYGHRRR